MARRIYPLGVSVNSVAVRSASEQRYRPDLAHGDAMSGDRHIAPAVQLREINSGHVDDTERAQATRPIPPDPRESLRRKS